MTQGAKLDGFGRFSQTSESLSSFSVQTSNISKPRTSNSAQKMIEVVFIEKLTLESRTWGEDNSTSSWSDSFVAMREEGSMFRQGSAVNRPGLWLGRCCLQTVSVWLQLAVVLWWWKLIVLLIFFILRIRVFLWTGRRNAALRPFCLKQQRSSEARVG